MSTNFRPTSKLKPLCANERHTSFIWRLMMTLLSFNSFYSFVGLCVSNCDATALINTKCVPVKRENPLWFATSNRLNCIFSLVLYSRGESVWKCLVCVQIRILEQQSLMKLIYIGTLKCHVHTSYLLLLEVLLETVWLFTV